MFTFSSISKPSASLAGRVMHETHGVSSLQIALGFAAFALVATIFLPPTGAYYGERIANLGGKDAGIDPVVTGSVEKKTRRYTIRRSVLTKDPSKPCVIYANGVQEGNC